MKTINVVQAIYVEAYKIELFFDDDTYKIVDFGVFLMKNFHPSWNKYRRIDKFKKFKIDHGNIVWGKNWDMMFPIDKLYSGKVS